MHINYRILKQNTFNDNLLLLYINHFLACFYGVKFFLTLDLYDRYHQIPINPSDCFITAFYCYYGFFLTCNKALQREKCTIELLANDEPHVIGVG